MLSLASMFAVAFGAATILPAQSEILFVALLAKGEAFWPLFIAATLGNTLGSVVNWTLGRFFSHLRHHRWFPLTEEQFQRAVGWYNRWGLWSLLLSWAPVVGDPLTIVAGVLRCDLGRFVAVVLLAKAGRYAVVAGAVRWFA